MPKDAALHELRVLQVDNVSKEYVSYCKPIYRLWSFFFTPRIGWLTKFVALKDVSFSLNKGETVGIVGRNGSGKSTLLQTIVGTLSPSEGTIQCRGRIAALLELGAGFNPEFTGKENVFLNASIYGLTHEQIEERYEKICEFAGIGEFIDQPVKTYSSGMYVRLAFAVIVHVDADILIIDEALAVGDALFSQKCMRFLEDFKERGSILFVSHDAGAVTRLCDRAIWLDKGTLVKEGSAKEVTESYLEHLYAQQQDVSGAISQREEESSVMLPDFEDGKDFRDRFLNGSNLRNDIKLQPFNIKSNSFGTGLIKISDVCIRDQQGSKLSYAVGGHKVVVDVCFRTSESISKVIVGFLLKNRQGQILFGDNSYLALLDQNTDIEGGGSYSAKFGLSLPYLPTDEYVLSVGVASGTQDEHVQHCWLHDALVINVLNDHLVHGIFGIPMGFCKLERLKG
ncbi:ABC transporter ATP-binding protein [uncultured Pseudoteredinibacter sp.]|uniref:ABC transporter ATP-binding protein n=1 Tax=uncultured Pseudoteredinibacter sp. TaxID=1641701 RepID=UPI0026350DB7|nr:ABC transporter ATP-binding protein [uncultured Pseudoteredinibacter sp.]